MGRQTLVVPIAEAIALISDGDTIGLGGYGMRRHPMAVIREIARRRLRNLHVVGWNNGIDVDLLIGAGCVATLETASVGLGGFGEARNFRRAAEAGALRVIEHSETSAMDRFRAAAMGLPFLPSKAGLGTDLPKTNPSLQPLTDPFTGEPWMAVAAVRPDVSIIHAHSADRWGNVALDPERGAQTSPDLMVARAGRTVIVSVEQIVSDQAIMTRPANTILPRAEITCVVEAPYGAHPCSCDARYEWDAEDLRAYLASSSSADLFRTWLDEFVHGVPDHGAYLDRIGARRLLTIARKRNRQA